MKFTINKFKRIENRTIEIPATIEGGNGIGKSSILEAISFVLTGKDLNGNEFKQVYDNRVDLHDAVADVTFIDNYGNEFRRVVKPIFQINRQGIEEIKIKRSTECSKNGIACNDFSSDFADFFKFGTDYFFRQKEADQRSIFIDILKSKMPDFDIKGASLKVKELKKSQKTEVDEVKRIASANAATKDVPVPTMPEEIERLNAEFLALSASSNPEATAEINKRNNAAMESYLSTKRTLSTEISETEIEISKLNAKISEVEQKIKEVEASTFQPKHPESTVDLLQKLNQLRSDLSILPYFETLEDYAEKFLEKNPIVSANAKKIAEIFATKFEESTENSGACPLSGEFCETAKLYNLKAKRTRFDAEINEKIEVLRAENRRILNAEMASVNAKFNAKKSEIEECEARILRIEESNRLLSSENAKDKNVFELERSGRLATLIDSLANAKKQNEALEATLREKRRQLEALLQPTPEKLPEQIEISEDLKNANTEFNRINKEIIGALAINGNNAKIIAENEKIIKEKQANLLKIGEEIVSLEAQITDYFSNLKGVIKSEFAGEIEIDVQLQEFVMSRNEYDDCFKITADGKVFPYECNGAFINNVKLQILNGFQRLINYSGITVLDNCEGNTTQPINPLNTKFVLAFATNDKDLIIK